MTILHLGVVDIPYAEEPRKTARPEKGDNARSTGDVAEYLENKYHVMEHFFQAHGDDIAALLENSVAGSLETLLMGGVTPPGFDLNASALEQIKKLFSKFLSNREMDALGYPGIPTLASIMGVNHRFKSGKGTPGRPSFIDTGLYEASFKAWIDKQ